MHLVSGGGQAVHHTEVCVFVSVDQDTFVRAKSWVKAWTLVFSFGFKPKPLYFLLKLKLIWALV